MPGTFDLTNLPLIEELYASYRKDPTSVDLSWRYFFEGVDFSRPYVASDGVDPASKILRLIDAYRRHGYKAASFNPLENPPALIDELDLERLGFSKEELPVLFPTCGQLKSDTASLQEIVNALKDLYASKIGFEYMGIGLEEERFIQERIEKNGKPRLELDEKHLILESLNRSEVFESFLHTKYPGQTRFSLEGNETLIPILAEWVRMGAKSGMKGFVMGMPHRGRLNVLTNILNKSHEVLFQEFEDVIPYLESETGDVKYHKGFSSDVEVEGSSIHLHLTANSSCLESVDGVVLGQTRALQVASKDEEKKLFGAVLMHGDAALSGQGVVYEILQMSQTEGFSVGGTLHIAVNNQIGYTTEPSEGRSTPYCTDIAKAFNIPVFHVNAEDPEGAIFIARLASEFRLRFQKDVFIDLNGYRKYGHNEGDEPGFTQPIHYKSIKGRKSIRSLYVEQLLSEGSCERKMADELELEFRSLLSGAFEKGKKGEKLELKARFGSSWDRFIQPQNKTLFAPFETKVSKALIEKILEAYSRIPDGFHLHPKLVKWLEDRKSQLQRGSFDWALAECLAFGSILLEGRPIRLSGQDVKRGTFSHRHAVWFDQETGDPYVPFSHLDRSQERFDVYNTILSEYGALAFEFGYSWAAQKTLVVWEAQYGDFDIGAQIAIDHYLVSAEQKWSRYSSLVLFLPHAYEGAGPEHSSARLERFLQLCAGDNIQVVYPTEPSQIFHLLRRQALREIKKPLIVLSPKSLLRLPACVSALERFTEGAFQEFIDDPKDGAARLLFCSGKIYYDLLQKRDWFPHSAIIRVEQIYPFHEERLKTILAGHPEAKSAIWVQEEPENMGAWEFIQPILKKVLPESMTLAFAGRVRSASTATGSRKKHLEEQNAILESLREKV